MNYLLRLNLSRTFIILNLALTSFLSLQQVSAQNPFMPPTAFIPDGEPHVFEYNGEKSLFIYGSRDERIMGFCGYGHDVWSAPVKDLSKWMNHGEIFSVKQVQDIGYGVIEEQHFGAPDCVYNPKTRKYYLYTFLGMLYKMNGVQGPLIGAKNYIPGFEDWGPKCIMASSDSPTGPFINPVICDWPPANKEGTFDPSVLVDELADGSIRVYAYWGMKSGDRCAELDPVDMHTIIHPKTRRPDRNAWHKTLDPDKIKNSSVFEASSIKKIDDNHYVFIYSPNERHSALAYCYSSSPEGPWIYGGKIIRNGIDWKGGNNHGSIAKVLDQWYVVYHKATINSKNRQAMIEPIDVKIDNEKVLIPQVEMTSQGIIRNGLDAFKRYNVNIACFRTNNAYIDGTVRNEAGLNPMRGLDGPNTTIGFKYFNFGKKAVKNKDDLKLKLNCKIFHPLTVSVFVAAPEDANSDKNWILIGEHPIADNFNEFRDYSIPINRILKNDELKKIGGLKDKLAVFVTFTGKEKNLCELIELEFSKGSISTPNPLNVINIKKNNKVKIVSTPTMARDGESVKLSIEPEGNYLIQDIKVIDGNGNDINVNKNKKAEYAPISFNFFMPNSPVTVEMKIK
ncbi:family 43 glycosylhydrolase [Marinifilum sp. RC60d5]|uniref:family 43 glycosylhydrolase n=1 Tax=Marinifilum sp. RC60d5 TaxID=3458414 RepID=UPI00403748FC